MAKLRRKRKGKKGPSGMGGGIPGGLGGNLMAQVRKMQEEMEKAQEELGELEVVGTAGGGVVQVVMDGHRNVKAIQIDPEVVDPEDVEMLQDLLLAAISEAAEKARALEEERLGGLEIPGLGL